MTTETPARPWSRAGVLTLGLLGCATLIYRDTIAGLIEIWLRSDTFAHGMLVFPLSGWLIWRQRDALARISPRPSLAGGVLLACTAFVWLLGRLAEALVVQQLAVVAMVPATVWLLLGNKVVAQLAFPLAFLFFAVPFGETLIPGLMEFTASFTVRALELTGIPVYRDGLYFSIPSGDFEVAKACSGIRYLMASVTLGTLYAYLNYHAWWRRAIFIGLSVMVPILANGLRAYGIVIIAHLSDMRLAVGVDHLVYGWVFFGVVMFLLFWAGLPFHDAPRPGKSLQASAGAARRASWPLLATTMTACLVLLLAAPLAVSWVQGRAAMARQGMPALPAAREAWRGPLEPTLAWQPLFRGADEQLLGRYEDGTHSVHVAVAYYGQQEQGAELVNSENLVIDASWLQMARERHSLRGGQGGVDKVVATRVRDGADPLLVWHWYLVGGTTTVSAPMVKLMEAFDSLGGETHGAALVALATSEDAGTAAARAVLGDFLAANGAALAGCVMSEACD